MKKQFLSVFALTAALFSAQAQDNKGGISPDMLGQIRQTYQGTASDKALRNAIGNNSIRNLALNQENMQDMDTHFPFVSTRKASPTSSRRGVAGFLRDST